MLNKGTRFALYALVELARRDGQSMTVAEFCREHDAPANHVSKVMQRLCRAGVVEGSRGARGGYRLVHDPRRLSMQDVVALFEGAPQPDACSLAAPGECCSLVSECSIRSVIHELETFATRRLSQVTIAELAGTSPRLEMLGGS